MLKNLNLEFGHLVPKGLVLRPWLATLYRRIGSYSTRGTVCLEVRMYVLRTYVLNYVHVRTSVCLGNKRKMMNLKKKNI